MTQKEPGSAGRTADIPCTGWLAKGGVRPLAGVMNAPEGGPGANVSAGRTARPSSTAPLLQSPALAVAAGPNAASAAAAMNTRNLMSSPSSWRAGARGLSRGPDSAFDDVSREVAMGEQADANQRRGGDRLASAR